MLKAGTPGCGGSDGPRRMSCGLRAPGSRQRPADAPCGPAHRWEAACRGIERDVGAALLVEGGRALIMKMTTPLQQAAGRARVVLHGGILGHCKLSAVRTNTGEMGAIE